MVPSLFKSFLSSLLKLLNFFHTFIGFIITIYAVRILTRCVYDGAPWFACAVMGVGVVMCAISTIGLVAAEIESGCWLYIFSILATLLIVLEPTLAGYILLDEKWETYLPHDATGELKRLHALIKENMDVFKWVAVTVLVVQVSSVLLTVVLRAMISTRIEYESESEEHLLVIRRPLLSTLPTHAPNSVENGWCSQMRQSIAQTLGNFRRAIVG